jgi:hypothetical protein
MAIWGFKRPVPLIQENFLLESYFFLDMGIFYEIHCLKIDLNLDLFSEGISTFK